MSTDRPNRRAALLALAAVVIIAAVVTVATWIDSSEPDGPRSTGAAASTPLPTAMHGSVRPGDAYVALGSSFVAGPGLSPVADQGCRRAVDNYATHVATALKLDLTDVSCAAATTDNVLTNPQTSDDGTLRPAQIEAVTPDTKLVTITIGGNDAGYSAALENYACLDTAACRDVTVDEAGVNAQLDTVTEKLVATIEAIKEAAPEAIVLLVAYPEIVPPANSAACAAIPLSSEHARFANSAGVRLHSASVEAAARTGITLVDSYAASKGHSACAPTEPWISPWTSDASLTGPVPFHPTPTGMRGMADLIIEKLARTPAR